MILKGPFGKYIYSPFRNIHKHRYEPGVPNTGQPKKYHVRESQ